MDTLSATDSYASLLRAFPDMDPVTLLSIFFLTLARIVPIMTLAPFFGAKNVPRVIRMMFSISLLMIFFPQNMMLVKTNLPLSGFFIGLFLKELLIGLILGFLSTVPFFIAQMAGSIIDHQRGSSALQVNDPTTQTQTGPIGILYNYILIALFFSLGGPFLFLDGLATSYQLIPVDHLISTTLFSPATPFFKMVFGLFQKMMTLSIQFSAPALIGILLTDMFLGIANRLAPQVQIVFLGASFKSWVGIAMMTAAWALIIKVLGKETILWVKQINQIIQGMPLYL
jgi:type III secretion protein T